MQIQQGDVLLEKVDSIPEGGKKVEAKERGYVLAEGEATGHAHVIEKTALAEMYEVDGVLYVRALEPVEVTHEEHKPQVLDPGIWKVGIVREYDYFKDMVREVID